jgi:hypothetical protein
MKVFLSYSVSPTDRYIVSLLVSELRKYGFSLESKASVPFLGSVADSIRTADLFIGIMTRRGKQNNNTFKEWKLARKYKVFNLLVLEKGISLVNASGANVIIFDKNNPQQAIMELQAIRNHLVHPRRISGTSKSPEPSNAAAVVAIVSIVALLSLMATGSKSTS